MAVKEYQYNTSATRLSMLYSTIGGGMGDGNPSAHSASGKGSTQRPRTKGTSRFTTTAQQAWGRDSKTAARCASPSPATGEFIKTWPASLSEQASCHSSKRAISGPASVVIKVQYAEAGTQTEPDSDHMV